MPSDADGDALSTVTTERSVNPQGIGRNMTQPM